MLRFMAKKSKSKKESNGNNYGVTMKLGMLLLSLSILGVMFLFLTDSLPEYDQEIENVTLRSYSNVLYRYEVVMYPSSGEVIIVSPDQERIELGVNTETWNINFGKIPANSTSSRYADLANIGSKPAKVFFTSSGDISPFIKFDKNDFTLDPSEDETVKITFDTKNAEPGNYNGRVDRIVKIPKYDFLYNFW